MFMIINMLKSKKLFMFVLIIISVAGLNAKWLYLDAGTGCDFTRINFKLWEDYWDVAGDLAKSNNCFAIPNFNFRLGLRLHERFIVTSDFQFINIDKFFYSQIKFNELLTNSKVVDYKLHIKSLKFVGVGIIFYPLQSFKLGGSIYYGSTNSISKSRNNFWFSVGYEVLIAYDLPINKIELTVGCRYFYADTISTNILDSIVLSYSVSSIGVFTKIRY